MIHAILFFCFLLGLFWGNFLSQAWSVSIMMSWCWADVVWIMSGFLADDELKWADELISWLWADERMISGLLSLTIGHWFSWMLCKSIWLSFQTVGIRYHHQYINQSVSSRYDCANNESANKTAVFWHFKNFLSYCSRFW